MLQDKLPAKVHQQVTPAGYDVNCNPHAITLPVELVDFWIDSRYSDTKNIFNPFLLFCVFSETLSVMIH